MNENVENVYIIEDHVWYIHGKFQGTKAWKVMQTVVSANVVLNIL